MDWESILKIIALAGAALQAIAGAIIAIMRLIKRKRKPPARPRGPKVHIKEAIIESEEAKTITIVFGSPTVLFISAFVFLIVWVNIPKPVTIASLSVPIPSANSVQREPATHNQPRPASIHHPSPLCVDYQEITGTDATAIKSLIKRESDLAKESHDACASPRADRCGQVTSAYRIIFAQNPAIQDVQSGHTWLGLDEIDQRFVQLPAFDNLDKSTMHIVKDCRSGEVSAIVTSSMELEGPSGPESHLGRELWTFENTQHRWKIKQIQFNLQQ